MREQTEQTVVCAACEDGKTVVRVTLDRKCVECGKYVSDDPRPLRRMTFAELVEYGRANDGNIVNGMPWSFTFNGVSISHENDECYLVNAFGGTQRFTPLDTLAVGPFGHLVVLYGLPTPPSDAGTSERETGRCARPGCDYARELHPVDDGDTYCPEFVPAAPAAEGPRAEPWTCHRVREYGGTCSTTNEGETCDACGADRPALPGAEAGTPTLVDGYDATFWRDSYRMLANAVDLHLGDYIQGDDVAEEAIYEDAIVQAGRRLAALTSEVRALRLLAGYATHTPECKYEGDEVPCDCGYAEAIAAARLASPSPTGAP